MQKLIFLDFDGVVHRTNTGVPRDWSLILKMRDYFLPEPVGLISQLCEQSGAKIVVSSAWRHDFSIDQFNQIFNGLVIGSTPQTLWTLADMRQGQTRYREVLRYLDDNALQNNRWIAIDDQAKHYPTDDNIIITDAIFGFTQNDFDRALKALNA